MRRIVQQTLFKGWSTWREIYEQRTKRKRLLQQAANRLMKPALVAALKHWETDWKAKQMKRAKMSLEEQLAEERALRQAAEARLAEVQAELTAAKEELKKGRGLDASVKQDLESQLEAERQARVEHLANVGIRRIMQQGIAKGWSAWREQYLDYQRKKRLLQNAGARMARPKMVHCFALWQNVRRAAHMKKSAQGQKQLMVEMAERHQAELAELHQASAAS